MLIRIIHWMQPFWRVCSIASKSCLVFRVSFSVFFWRCCNADEISFVFESLSNAGCRQCRCCHLRMHIYLMKFHISLPSRSHTHTHTLSLSRAHYLMEFNGNVISKRWKWALTKFCCNLKTLPFHFIVTSSCVVIWLILFTPSKY